MNSVKIETLRDMNDSKIIPPSQWVDKDGYVLIVKCLNRDGTTYGGFKWPAAGPVKPDKWSRTPDCDSGGLFGWPWGIGIGDGRIPDACTSWRVFRAKPENVITIGNKVKAVPGGNGELPEVVYSGPQAGAMAFTMFGRVQMVLHNANGSASATGYSGSASATGYSGSASATGASGSASATGYSGSASATGDRGSASATGYRGSASATGEECCAVSLGMNAHASGEKGCWIILAEWKEISGVWHRISVKTFRVDGKRVKAMEWYCLRNGKLTVWKD